MPSGKFDLIGEIRLAGPVNLTQVANNIQSKLSGITANVKVRVDGTANRSLSALNTKFVSLNKNIIAANQSAKNLSATISAMSYAFSKLQSQSIKNTSTQVKQISKNLKQTKKSADEAADAIEDFGAKTSLALKRFAAYTLATTVIFGLVRAFQSSVSEAIQFERSLIKVEQATRTSTRNIEKLNAEITRLAKGFGVSSAELVDVSRTLSQAGLQINDVEKALEALAKSNLAPTFGDIADTTEGAIAVMSQFNLEAQDLEGVLGSINAVAANFAVESEDIISAIRRAGGVFAAASEGARNYNTELGEFTNLISNTDKLNQFIALFTSVRSTTRESAETIATGLRTILTRIQRPSTLSALQGVGVDLTDDQGKFVGAFEAFRKLNESLSQLDTRDPKFNKIVEELGGFRQVGKVIPLILRFNKSLDALEVARQGTDSLEKDATIALQSLAVQIEKTRENFKAFVREFVASDTFKVFAKQVLGIANAFIEVGKSLKPLFPILGILGAAKATSGAIKFTRGFLGNASTPQQDVAGALSNVTKAQNISSSKLLLATNSTNNILANILRDVGAIRYRLTGSYPNSSRIPFAGFNPSETSPTDRKVPKLLKKTGTNPALPFGSGVFRDLNTSILAQKAFADPNFLQKSRVRNVQGFSGFLNSISLTGVQGPPRPPKPGFFARNFPTFGSQAPKIGASAKDFFGKNKNGIALGGVLAASLASGAISNNTRGGAVASGALSGGAAGAGIGFTAGGPIGAAIGAVVGGLLGLASSLSSFNKEDSIKKFEQSIEDAVYQLTQLTDFSSKERSAIIGRARRSFVDKEAESTKNFSFAVRGITDPQGRRSTLAIDRTKNIESFLQSFQETEEKSLRELISKRVDEGATSGQALRELINSDKTNFESIAAALSSDKGLLNQASQATRLAIESGAIGTKDESGALKFEAAKIIQLADLDQVFKDIELEKFAKNVEYEMNKLNRTFSVLAAVANRFNTSLEDTISTFDQAEQTIRGVPGNIGFANAASRVQSTINNPLGVDQATFQKAIRDTLALSGGNPTIGNALNLVGSADSLERSLIDIFKRSVQIVENASTNQDAQIPTVEATSANIIRSEFPGIIGEAVAAKIENVLAPREAKLNEIENAFTSGDLLKDIPDLDQAKQAINAVLEAFKRGAALIDSEIPKYISAQESYRSAVLDAAVAASEDRRLINSIRSENTRTNPFGRISDIRRIASQRAGFDVGTTNIGDQLISETNRLEGIRNRVDTFNPQTQSASEFTALAQEAAFATDNIARMKSSIAFLLPELDNYKNDLIQGIQDLRRQSSEARSFFIGFASSDAAGRRQTITDLNNAGIAARGGVLPLGPQGVGSAFKGFDAIASFNPEIADQLRRKTLVNQFQAAGVDLNQKTLVEGPGGEFLTLKEVLLGGSKPEERMVAELEKISEFQAGMRDALISIEGSAAAIAGRRFEAAAASPIELGAAVGSVNPNTGELGGNFNQNVTNNIGKLEELLNQLNETEIKIKGNVDANINLTGGDELAKAVAAKIADEVKSIIDASVKNTEDRIYGKNTGPRNTGFYRNSQGNYQGARAF